MRKSKYSEHQIVGALKQAEALTSVLININRQYKCHAGITISGLD